MKDSPNSKRCGIAMRVFSFVITFALLASLAIAGRGSFFGHVVSVRGAEDATETVTMGSETVLNTTELCKDVQGYGGPVPVEIYVTGARIDSVRVLPNAETPGFFSRVEESGLLKAWDGLTLDEAATKHPDAVTGATYSSKAVIANVTAGAKHLAGLNAEKKNDSACEGTSAGMIAALIVIISAMILPLFVKNKSYRLVQQLLNVGVLGFWTGTFIDYTLMLKFMANGPQFALSGLITVLLMIVGFIYPLFAREGHYCAWVCPLGSLQDIAGKCCGFKFKMKPAMVKFLNSFRIALWGVLLCLLWAGWGAEWIDYELFTGFVVESASWVVIGVGAAFIILSLFIPRPFCRFVCPTGTILRLEIRPDGCKTQTHK